MSIDQDFAPLLEELGLSSLEKRIYLSCLTLGPSSASSIAKQSKVHRITTYETLKRLAAKGFVTLVMQERKAAHFEPTDIKDIHETLMQKKSRISEMLEGLDALKPYFSKLSRRHERKPEILYYEGKDGIRTQLFDSLKRNPTEILSFTTADFLHIGFGPETMKQYWTERTQRGIPSRGIMPRTARAVATFTDKKNNKELRGVKLVPESDYNFRNQIDVYADSVAITSLEPGNEHGIIIRNQSLADSVSSLFELLWKYLP